MRTTTKRVRYAAGALPVPEAGPWPALDKRSPMPLYFQLRTAIEEMIDSGQ